TSRCKAIRSSRSRSVAAPWPCSRASSRFPRHDARIASPRLVARGDVHSDPSSQSAAVRALAEQAFSRAAGAPLVPGNSIRVLKDAKENYPAWLEAIAGAKRSIHIESYI